MPFSHIAFTDQEAADYRKRSVQALVRPKKLMGIPAHIACYVATGVLLLTSAIVGSLWEAAAWWATGLIGAAGVCWMLGVGYKADVEEAEYGRTKIDEELAPASNEDLAWIVDKCGPFPEIAQAAQAWIAQDRTIRERDLRAIRAYFYRAQAQAERRALLAKLAGNTHAAVSDH